jgi:hypothetical protein
MSSVGWLLFCAASTEALHVVVESPSIASPFLFPRPVDLLTAEEESRSKSTPKGCGGKIRRQKHETLTRRLMVLILLMECEIEGVS